MVKFKLHLFIMKGKNNLLHISEAPWLFGTVLIERDSETHAQLMVDVQFSRGQSGFLTNGSIISISFKTFHVLLVPKTFLSLPKVITVVSQNEENFCMF